MTACYQVAVKAWGIQPSEFWGMSHVEWWWIADSLNPEQRYAGTLTEDDCERLYAKLKA